MTPCQKCKADLARARARIEELGVRELALRGALLEAVARLNEFLQAFEGAPDPSENDTKNLVVRLLGVLDGD